MPKRVLFVDDEPRVLQGLRRMLYDKAGEWELLFAGSGSEALSQLADRPVDVVVSDMRMPEMDGATLLDEIRTRYPETARIMLSGYADDEAAARAVQVAQQVLAKPCDAELLTDTVRRVLALQERLRSEHIRAVVGRVGDLPSPPAIYHELTKRLADPAASLDDIVGLVRRDPALTAKILQLVNSAFFGRPQPSTDIGHAVAVVGSSMLRHLVTAAAVYQTFRPAATHFSLTAFQAHSWHVAAVTEVVARGESWSHAGFTSGLLHDVGKLVLATCCSEEWDQISAAAVRDKGPSHVQEQEILGVSHADLGAYVLGMWGLPHVVLEAVACHHTPSDIPDRFGPAVAVFIANLFSHASSEANNPSLDSAAEQVVARAGVSDRVEGWWQAARSISVDVGG